jgi:hypothetical protein
MVNIIDDRVTMLATVRVSADYRLYQLIVRCFHWQSTGMQDERPVLPPIAGTSYASRLTVRVGGGGGEESCGEAFLYGSQEKRNPNPRLQRVRA